MHKCRRGVLCDLDPILKSESARRKIIFGEPSSICAPNERERASVCVCRVLTKYASLLNNIGSHATHFSPAARFSPSQVRERALGIIACSTPAMAVLLDTIIYADLA